MSTYVCGDLHGHYDIYLQIKQMLKPNDIVYCIGDCGDRGPESWRTITSVYKDPQFIYLKGNHEDMLIKAATDFIENECWDEYSYTLCLSNGGYNTLLDWEADKLRQPWLYKLQQLPLTATYESNGRKFILCHAGFTPWKNRELPNAKALLWDRAHYYATWDEDKMDDVIIVHGHTPADYLAEDIKVKYTEGPLWYCNNHKICIDSGGFYTGKFNLLNLDTLENTILSPRKNTSIDF